MPSLLPEGYIFKMCMNFILGQLWSNGLRAGLITRRLWVGVLVPAGNVGGGGGVNK